MVSIWGLPSNIVDYKIAVCAVLCHNVKDNEPLGWFNGHIPYSWCSLSGNDTWINHALYIPFFNFFQHSIVNKNFLLLIHYICL